MLPAKLVSGKCLLRKDKPPGMLCRLVTGPFSRLTLQHLQTLRENLLPVFDISTDRVDVTDQSSSVVAFSLM